MAKISKILTDYIKPILISYLLLKIHLLEDSSELKIHLNYGNGETWCENIVVPELKLLANSAEADEAGGLTFEFG